MADPQAIGTAISIGKTIFKGILSIFGSSKKKRYYRVAGEIMELLYDLGHQELALQEEALEFREDEATWRKEFETDRLKWEQEQADRRISLDEQRVDWEQKFAGAKLNMEREENALARTIRDATIAASLRKDRRGLATSFALADASYRASKQSWALRMGLFNEAEAENLGLVTEAATRELTVMDATAARHDAAIVTGAAASGLINRQTEQIRQEQREVYGREREWIIEAADAKRRAIRRAGAIRRIEADDQMLAFKLQREKALEDMRSQSHQLAETEQIQQMAQEGYRSLESRFTQTISGLDEGIREQEVIVAPQAAVPEGQAPPLEYRAGAQAAPPPTLSQPPHSSLDRYKRPTGPVPTESRFETAPDLPANRRINPLTGVFQALQGINPFDAAGDSQVPFLPPAQVKGQAEIEPGQSPEDLATGATRLGVTQSGEAIPSAFGPESAVSDLMQTAPEDYNWDGLTQRANPASYRTLERR